MASPRILSTVLALLSLLLLLVALGSDHWLGGDAILGSLHEGLWKSCLNSVCGQISSASAKFESSGVAYKYWFLKDDNRDTGPAVATTDPGRALREPGGRIRMVGATPDNCSLSISNMRARDRAHYYFRFMKGDFQYSYLEAQSPVDVTARNVSVVLENGSFSYTSVLSFTPALGDDGKELVSTIMYPAVVGVSTRRAVRLHVHCQ
ncbi:Sialic acid-binding Ig-like lectin 13 [Chelonia mydas]|uniref:Sialic acid-binding Ig-like lectin 13 n=1 Tax=Chelonia mydas TaxID=8469 RepID=M7AMC1_CHEMY|nr:Sialic acid-binding Ig-like lectin 13 [Chelonia mydas]